jgi:dCTP deaminase
VLSGREIIKQVANKNIEIVPFCASQAGPNSYDLRLGETIVQSRSNRIYDGLPAIDTHQPGMSVAVLKSKAGGYLLRPGQLYLGHTIETIYSRFYVPTLHGRSTAARHGIQIHLAAGFGDVGWRGQYVLEIVNLNNCPVMIYPGDRICQVAFDRVEGDVDLYNSDYQGQQGIRLAKSLGDV